jgi:acetyl-CoA carboxylase carboxyl transferase subunit alpha
MKITAQDLAQMGIIDVIISEPLGGAHRDKTAIMRLTGNMLERALREFDGVDGQEIREARHQKFLAIGRTL